MRVIRAAETEGQDAPIAIVIGVAVEAQGDGPGLRVVRCEGEDGPEERRSRRQGRRDFG